MRKILQPLRRRIGDYIMEFFDNAVNKAKEAFDIACKKTNEVVSTQKQKFDAASVANKRDHDFEALGRLYFETVKDVEALENEEIKALIKEIKLKNEQINEINREINNAKNKRVCPNCSAVIEKDAVFCSSCGERVITDE